MTIMAADVVLYFCAMAAAFRLRRRVGLGVMLCALGAMHFLETYLSVAFYVPMPFGFIVSPGSAALFTGKVMMLLLIYIREDAATVRQPIYGLFFGNLLLVGIVGLVRLHDVGTTTLAPAPDFDFLASTGVLMLWGSTLLFIDSILIVLLYTQTGRWLGRHTTLRIWVSAACVLTFDQLGFYAGLRLLTDAPASALAGGWIAKMCTSALFSVLTGLYLRYVEPASRSEGRPGITEVFDALTYRERYEALLERSHRDGLTRMLTRDRYERDGALLVREAQRTSTPLSLLVIDVDHFKAVNDRFGHMFGDQALKRIAEVLSLTLRGTDCIYRFGGEEFVTLCPGLPGEKALQLAERLRMEVARARIEGMPDGVTVSIGVASCPDGGCSLDHLFHGADKALYRAKQDGRNLVVWGGHGSEARLRA